MMLWLMRESRHWGKLALAALLACLVPTAAHAAPELKVMTFNIRLPLAQDGPNAWDHRRDIAAEIVAEEQPDVIGTQELHKPQGDYLAERLRGYAWFGVDRRGGHADEHMGIFYRRDRFRLLYSGNFWLSDTPLVPGSISWDHPYPRMVTWGLFEDRRASRHFYVLNTHLPYREEDGEARRKGASMIAAWIARFPPGLPVILLGDFNALPGSPTHASFAPVLRDAWLAAPEKCGPDETFHAFSGKADRRIDWILSRGFEVQRACTITENRGGRYPSDHFPVTATLKWPGR